jgi:hypothetical protein
MDSKYAPDQVFLATVRAVSYARNATNSMTIHGATQRRRFAKLTVVLLPVTWGAEAASPGEV